MATNKNICLMQSLTIVAFTWVLCYNPALVDYLPIYRPGGTLHDIPPIPPVITHTGKIWRLALLSLNNTGEALDEANRIAEFEFKSMADLRAYGEDLMNDQSVSFVQKVSSFMTVVNLIFLIALLGLCFTVIPFASYLTEQLISLITMLSYASLAAQRLAQWLLHLSKQYAYQIGYMIAACITVESIYLKDDITGVYLALAGSAFMHLLVSYKVTTEINVRIALLYLLQSAPLAVHHDSQLLGFVTVVAFYVIVFRVLHKGIELTGSVASAITPLLILPVYLALHSKSNQSSFLKPFNFGIYVFAVYGFHLPLLFNMYLREGDWQRVRVTHAVGLLFGLSYGALLNNQVMFNVAIMFSAIRMYLELRLVVRRRRSKIVFSFFSYLALFFAAFWFHAHPDFLISVLSG